MEKSKNGEANNKWGSQICWLLHSPQIKKVQLKNNNLLFRIFYWFWAKLKCGTRRLKKLAR